MSSLWDHQVQPPPVTAEPTGACGAADEDFVMLTLRAFCWRLHAHQSPIRWGVLCVCVCVCVWVSYMSVYGCVCGCVWVFLGLLVSATQRVEQVRGQE